MDTRMYKEYSGASRFKIEQLLLKLQHNEVHCLYIMKNKKFIN